MTRQQLLAVGLGREAINYRVASGRLHRLHRGVYAVGHPPTTPLQHAMAAVLACGPGAVLSHGSALTLWGIWKRWDRPFDVIVKADRRPKGVKPHRNRLDRRDITRHQNIPVTTLARTLLDMARQMPAKSLNRAVNTGRMNRDLTLAALHDVIKRPPHHRGRRALEAVVGIAPQRPTRSGFEDDFGFFCKRHGLPRPQTNTIVCGHEVDVFFAAEKVIVELDSWDYHSSRFSFEDDRRRDADTTAAGCVTVRITPESFEAEPKRQAATLQAILARRRGLAA